MKLLVRLLLILIGLMLPAVAGAAPDGVTKRGGIVDADPALWVIRDADTTLYLFGTVHMLKPGLSWFDEGIARAFAASDELMLEILPLDDPAALAPLLMELAQDPGGRTMAKRLSAEDHAAYSARLTAMGASPADLDRFEPWFITMNLAVADYMRRGLSYQSGVERVLEGAAKSAGKSITALETAEQQMRMLDSVPDEEQVAALMSFVRDGDELLDQMDELIGHWAAGEAEAAGRLMNDGMADTPETARIILTERNRRWVDQLVERLDRPGTVFVAVGTGHLIGTDNVRALLEARGLTAEPVPY